MLSPPKQNYVFLPFSTHACNSTGNGHSSSLFFGQAATVLQTTKWLGSCTAALEIREYWLRLIED